MATETFSQYISGLPIAPSTTPGSDLLPILQGGVTERAITPLALFGGIPIFGSANAGTVPASGSNNPALFLNAAGNFVSGPPSTTPLTVGVSSITGGASGKLLLDNGGVVGEINPSPSNNIAARFGSMDVWQRGAGGSASITVPASTVSYTVDGWYISTGVNQAFTVFAFTGIAPGSFKSAIIQRNAGQTGVASIVFGGPLDSDEIALFAGQFVTLSFTASTGVNWSPSNGSLSFLLICGTGVPKKQVTGYTGQTTAVNGGVNIAPGTPAARYQATSAAIVPTSTTQAEIIFLWTPVGTAGASDSLNVDDVQLEVVANATSLATPFAAKDFATQLRLAQRHFAKTFPYGTAPATGAGSAGALWQRQLATTLSPQFPWRYPVPMRTTPVITTFNPVSANANARDLTSSVDLAVTQPDLVPHSPDAASIICAVVGVNNSVAAIHATADAGI